MITDTVDITSYYISLPSGGAASVIMQATAGELFVTGALILLLFVQLWPAIVRLAASNAKR